MALGLTQPLTEMITRNISWGGKGGRCIGLTTLPPSCVPIFLKSGSLNLLEPSGPAQACNGIALLYYYYYYYYYYYLPEVERLGAASTSHPYLLLRLKEEYVCNSTPSGHSCPIVG